MSSPLSEEKFDAFAEQYELDMRGDKNLENGNKGIIGEIREIKKYHKEYPSLLWLFAHKPIPTISAVIFIYLLLMMLYTVGLFSYIPAYAEMIVSGTSIPSP